MVLLYPTPHFSFCMIDNNQFRGYGQFERRVHETRNEDGYVTKRRELFVPDEETREAHREMLDYMYEVDIAGQGAIPEGAFVAGAMRGSTILDNVRPHLDNKTYFMLDIKDAFPSVNVDILSSMAYDNSPMYEGLKVVDFIHNYATTDLTDGLPMGAPASPYLFNTYMYNVDDALAYFCAERGLAYSRWLDDVTISSPEGRTAIGAGTRRSIIDIIQSQEGLRINHKKSRLHTRDERPVTITGVSLYPDGRVQPRPQILEGALRAFDEVADDVYTMQPIGASHLARLHGHHGALIGASIEPHNATMMEAIARYRTTVRLAEAAIAIDSEKPFEPNPERLRIIKSMLKTIDVLESRARHDAQFLQD